MLTNYGYIEQEEKSKFKNLPLEYVIEQVDIVEKNIPNGVTKNEKTVLPSHFVKYLCWNLINKATLQLGLKSEVGLKILHCHLMEIVYYRMQMLILQV